MSAKKRPGAYAPMPTGFFPHPKTHLVAQIHPLAPYAYLYLVSLEAVQYLGGNESGEVKVTHLDFTHHGLLGDARGQNGNPLGVSEGLNKRILAAFSTVGWVEVKGFDGGGFHVLMRKSAEWHGQDLNRPKRREEKKEEEDDGSEVFKAEVREVFDYWRGALEQPGAKLGAAIARSIRGRLREGRSVAEIKQAINGCASSQFHRDGGHISLTLICRSDDKLIGFMARAPKRKGDDFNEGMGIT